MKPRLILVKEAIAHVSQDELRCKHTITFVVRSAPQRAVIKYIIYTTILTWEMSVQSWRNLFKVVNFYLNKSANKVPYFVYIAWI